MTTRGQLGTNMCQFTWTLKDFSKLGKNFGDLIISPIFNMGDLQWKLLLYPHGENDSWKDKIAVFLKLESLQEISVHFEIILLNVIEMRTAYKFTSKIRNWGWRGLIKRDTLIKGKDMLVDDTLNISCTIHLDVFSGKEVNIDKVVLKDYKSLFFNENFSDLTITIKKNKMKVHKNILSARSKVFKAMLHHDMKENNTNNIKITDISYNIMKELLLFIYSGEVNDLEKNARALLPAAEKYEIEELKVLCEKSIWKNVTIEDACEILRMANSYNCSTLKTKIIEFIIANVKEVNETPGFKKLIRSNPELFEEIFAEVVKKKC